MKKLVLITALLAGTTIPFNGFAKKEEEKVTLRRLGAEALGALIRAAAAYQYYAHVHDSIKPTKGVDTAYDEVFDTFFKGFWTVLVGLKAKSLFEKIELFLIQQTKPLTDPIVDTIKDAV